MAKKSRSDRWARGWATRRAKREGVMKAQPESQSPSETKQMTLSDWKFPAFLGDARTSDGAPSIQQPNVTDLIMAAARKRNGRAAVDELISGHVTARSTEYQRQSAHAADLFQRATLESHRDEVICGLIAEFDAARGLGSSSVWKISHRFWAHVVNALKDAGYSAHGRANRAVGVINQEPRG